MSIMRNSIFRTAVIIAAFSVLLPLVGCDMFRSLAGRPTAEEVELLRIEKLKAEEAVRQARVDSLARLQAEMEDSLAIMDSLSQIQGTILNPSEMGGLFTTRLDSRYYIVVGSFRSRSNAETLFTQVMEKGYSPILINFRNGFNSIAVSPADSLREAFHALRAVKAEPFCPDDVWILVNE